MNLDFSKEWFADRINLEGECEISAGSCFTMAQLIETRVRMHQFREPIVAVVCRPDYAEILTIEFSKNDICKSKGFSLGIEVHIDAHQEEPYFVFRDPRLLRAYLNRNKPVPVQELTYEI
jgi:hypothetical protein